MLGERIANLRKAKRLSQYELADRLGFSRGKLANYEQGSRQPDYETLQKIAEFFEVNIDYLLTGKIDNESVKVAGKEIILTPEEYRVFEVLKKHPILFNDLASDPEKKIKELIKLQKAKKLLLDEDEEEYGEGFGDIED